MFDKIKYYLLAFGAGIVAVATFFLTRKSDKPIDTKDLDKRIDEKKDHLKLLEKEEVKVENLKADEVVDYWKK